MSAVVKRESGKSKKRKKTPKKATRKWDRNNVGWFFLLRKLVKKNRLEEETILPQTQRLIYRTGIGAAIFGSKTSDRFSWEVSDLV